MAKRADIKVDERGARQRSSRALFLSLKNPCGGFTLIELMVALTVLSILTVGVLPLVRNSVKRSREYQLRESLREMRDAIKEFRRDTVGMQCTGLSPSGLPSGGTQQQPPHGVGGGMLPPGQAMPGAPAPPDPRSKVVIGDCTIFGVENPDHYPPTLETLVEGVSVVPRGGMAVINSNPLEDNATDNKLTAVKKKKYLRAVPVDPMTSRAEWDLRSSYDAADASGWGSENVFDVRSKSRGTALNGEKYADW
ncbi:MAG: type II secretion system GspH family protein [Acidobacteriota bacterium]|nr:type II secretion system GspH family protein [Acidobacteriota bacterium]